MKELVLAAFIAALAAGSQTLAAVSSLPIGSVEKVLNQYILNTDSIWVNVQSAESVQDIENGNVSFLFMGVLTNYTRADGTSESVNALCQRTVATGDQTELKTLLQKKMREAVKASVDPNDTNLQGRVIAVLADGVWKPDPNNSTQGSGTFSVLNTFVLGALKDPEGKTIIPESAYEEVYMQKRIGIRVRQSFFIGNVASGEVKDGFGNIIDKVIIPSWATNTIILNNEVLSGQPGTIELRYTDGSSQIFNLADGSLLLLPLPPALTITPVAGATSLLSSVPRPGVKLTVVSAPGTVRLEYADGLGGKWLPLVALTNSTSKVEFTDTVSRPARFYRASVGQ